MNHPISSQSHVQVYNTWCSGTREADDADVSAKMPVALGMRASLGTTFSRVAQKPSKYWEKNTVSILLTGEAIFGKKIIVAHPNLKLSHSDGFS